MLRDDSGAPVLLELEAVEPNLYFDQVPEAAARLADAIVASANRLIRNWKVVWRRIERHRGRVADLHPNWSATPVVSADY